MPKPSACNDDRAIVVATFCWTTVRARPRRPPIRERAPFFVRWRDHDPSRIALSRDNGDFGRRAWRDHVELPDSAAELPFDCRGGLLARRFRCSRYDLDHTGDRQKPESGSERTETFCKKLHRYMRQRKSSASNYRTLHLSVLAIFSAPPAGISLYDPEASARMEFQGAAVQVRPSHHASLSPQIASIRRRWISHHRCVGRRLYAGPHSRPHIPQLNLGMLGNGQIRSQNHLWKKRT